MAPNPVRQPRQLNKRWHQSSSRRAAAWTGESIFKITDQILKHFAKEREDLAGESWIVSGKGRPRLQWVLFIQPRRRQEDLFFLLEWPVSRTLAEGKERRSERRLAPRAVATEPLHSFPLKHLKDGCRKSHREAHPVFLEGQANISSMNPRDKSAAMRCLSFWQGREESPESRPTGVSGETCTSAAKAERSGSGVGEARGRSHCPPCDARHNCTHTHTKEEQVLCRF